MKITKFLLLGLAFFAFSCSDDDDASPSLQKKALSLSENSQVIAAPTALLTSDDPQAQTAAAWIAQANAMSGYLQFFNIPAGTSQSTSKITASNGRGKDAGDYVVYVWNDEDSGYSVAYQISEETDSYVFEIFLKIEGEFDWLKYFHAEEKKDRSEGFMKIYDIFGFYSDDASVVWLNYAWSREGDIFHLTMTDYTENFNVEMTVNQKTKAGNVVYHFDGFKQYELTWNANGSGSWAYYDEDGNVTEDGEWTV